MEASEEALVRSSPHEYISDELFGRLGYFNNTRSSSFINYPKEKPGGFFRIGCFGDSFTYGDEVDDKFDFPYLLSAELRERGIENIEVLNFGSSGYGFFQTFQLWEEFSQLFSLDSVIIGPECFFPERERSFRSIMGVRPLLLHSRYILKSGRAERIDPAGKTPAEQFRKYTRFIPPLRYIRYDYEAPFVLGSILKGRRELRNPFYYRKNYFDEIKELYKLLLSKMSEKEESIIVLSDRPEIIALFEGMDENIRPVPIHMTRAFPYRAKNHHNSPLGNHLIARQLADIYTKSEREESYPIASFREAGSEVSMDIYPGIRGELSGYELSFKFDGVRFASFASAIPPGESRFTKELEHKGILALRHKNIPFFNSFFYALDGYIPEDGEKIYAEINGETQRAGRIKRMAGPLNILLLDIDGEDKRYWGREYNLLIELLLGLFNRTSADYNSDFSALLRTEEETILTLDIKRDSLSVISPEHYKVSPHSDSFFLPSDMGVGEYLYLRAEDADKNVVLLPFGIYESDVFRTEAYHP